MTPLAETLVVQLTPQGRGAVSVVMVVGPDSIRMVASLFQSVSRRNLEDVADNQISYGCWTTGEDVVVVRRSDLVIQNASTLAVEVQCHGGSVAVGAIVADLKQAGCQLIDWKDWLQLKEPDGIRVAAQVALASAPTLRTAKHLLDQYYGAFHTAIKTALDRIAANEFSSAIGQLTELLSWAEFGQHLTKPWKVVVAGNTNVGKSSLINALVGFDRAIVSQQPGTTRDVLTATTAIDGWPVELADTAGIRPSSDEIEQQGVDRAHATTAQADLVIHVADIQSDEAEMRSQMVSPANNRALRVLNKIDLLDVADRKPSGHLPGDSILTSAKTSLGIAELVQAIGKSLVPIVPATGTPIPFTGEQYDQLDRALAFCHRNDSPSAQKALRTLLGYR